MQIAVMDLMRVLENVLQLAMRLARNTEPPWRPSQLAWSWVWKPRRSTSQKLWPGRRSGSKRWRSWRGKRPDFNRVLTAWKVQLQVIPVVILAFCFWHRSIFYSPAFPRTKTQLIDQAVLPLKHIQPLHCWKLCQIISFYSCLPAARKEKIEGEEEKERAAEEALKKRQEAAASSTSKEELDKSEIGLLSLRNHACIFCESFWFDVQQ